MTPKQSQLLCVGSDHAWTTPEQQLESFRNRMTHSIDFISREQYMSIVYIRWLASNREHEEIVKWVMWLVVVCFEDANAPEPNSYECGCCP